MSASQFIKATAVALLFLGVVVFSPIQALAANQWFQQALFLAHINLGGGQFFTTNFVFAATDTGAVSINVKCFNDSFQRIGPPAGVNVALSAVGQVVQHTPTTLGVTTDPLFASGAGWCWASSIASGLDYTTQITVGVTTDVTVGGILNSPSSTFVATNTGLGETSSNTGGVPFFTTTGGAQHFIVLLNPLTVTRTLTLNLHDASGNPQGLPLVRVLNGRALNSVSVPAAFGVATPPTSGSVRISATGAGWLGWYLQVYANGRAIFNSIGIDGDFNAQLPLAGAP